MIRMQTNSAILWEGPSALTGDPIRVFASGLLDASRNTKTGAQVQTFIVPLGVKPHEAVKTGADAAVCGECAFRPLLAKPAGHAVCYVNTAQGVRSGAAFVDRVRPYVDPSAVAEGLDWRFGAWGDPAAAPTELWRTLAFRARSHTGFTHQWRTCDPALAVWCMASCDSEEEALEALQRGWRPFLVLAPGAADPDGFAHCNASAERGYRTHCVDCRACGGLSAKARAPIVIWAHDTASRAKRLRLERSPA